MQYSTRTILFTLCGIGLAGSSRPAVAQSCGSGQLSLSATASLTLPSTFGIQGLDAAGDGRLTLWSPMGEMLVVDASRRLRTYQLPDTVSPVGVAPSDGGGFRLIDTRSGRELLADTLGRIVPLGKDLRGYGEVIERAVPYGDGWILGVANLRSRRYVVRRVEPGRDVVLFESAAADSVQRIPRYTLTVTSRGLLLGQVTAPFTLLRVDPTSGRRDTLPPPLAGHGAPRIPADSLNVWRAVSVVPLDCAMLVTLTDLTSDRRILVRYRDDQVERYTRLEAPLGLMARIPGTQTMLGARRAGELELVWYDWRWVREPSSAGH